MKKMSIAATIATVCMFTGISTASAKDYTFAWKNSLNHFTYSNNADAVCRDLITEIKAGNTTVAIKTIASLSAQQSASVTLSAPACTSTKFTATCTFRDHDKTVKTETKSKTDICWGGDVILLPSPWGSTEWTSFEYSFYCTPPCR